ncbi:MAG TPA: DUF2520 domain-containing protein [Acidimicrobiales bacterium]|nr:DUF2520 domain-containing protein [Acidimicrobiales bacterium]
MAGALAAVGWRVVGLLGRDAPDAALRHAGRDVDVVLLATPDAAVREVAAAIEPVESTVVVHLAGSLGLEVLAPHPRRAAVHPLLAMPDPEVGSARLRGGAWFAVAGDPMAWRMVDDLGGRAFEVADANRSAYHAAAVIASNHLVALLGQVERVAATAGVPFAAYLDLVRATVDNVAALGPAAALTGPAARGDEATIEAHLAALDPDELATYEAMAREARRLAGRADVE